MPLTALSLTPAARDWLAETTAARVFSAFERACNLVNQNDSVLTLVTAERGLTPFALMIGGDSRSPFGAVTVADRVEVTPNRLTVGALDIRLATITLWNPVPDWPMLRKMFTNDPGRLGHLADLVMELATPASLLDLYRLRQADKSPMEQALLDRARHGAVDLLRGLQLGHLDQAVAGARRLAGAGPGVTPAGDDFLVGVALAGWAGLFGKGPVDQMETVLDAAGPLTTLLSAAYLRAAKRGECIAPWHTLFAALLLSDSEVTRMAAKSLMSVGHSSGSDGLAGFLAVHLLKA